MSPVFLSLDSYDFKSYIVRILLHPPILPNPPCADGVVEARTAYAYALAMVGNAGTIANLLLIHSMLLFPLSNGDIVDIAGANLVRGNVEKILFIGSPLPAD